ncbi:MAG: hypothetical protein FJ319_08340 [SAR202 cluster bacterium]|nr:hypothetical protein [SAR202 cluster bacterium]
MNSWRAAGAITAVGSVVLIVGLMLGPTLGEETADALRDIAGFRTMYVLTNMISFAGALVIAAGLLAIARLQAEHRPDSAIAVWSGAASAAGGALTLLTLVLESVVEPAIAERFVAGADQAAHLAVAQAVTDIDGSVFGLGFMLFMAGIALAGLGLVLGAGPRLNRWFLLAGVALAVVASPTGIAYLFDATRAFGQMEPYLGLSVLVWLVALGAMLWRSGSRAAA